MGATYLTTFGGPGDGQSMACGESKDDGSWYYAASKQRYGCGAHIQITANGKCVVVETDDYGPDVCVENAAGGPIIDASPLVAEALFGASEEGWSDHAAIQVTVVPPALLLGSALRPLLRRRDPAQQRRPLREPDQVVPAHRAAAAPLRAQWGPAGPAPTPEYRPPATVPAAGVGAAQAAAVGAVRAVGVGMRPAGRVRAVAAGAPRDRRRAAAAAQAPAVGHPQAPERGWDQLWERAPGPRLQLALGPAV